MSDDTRFNPHTVRKQALTAEEHGQHVGKWDATAVIVPFTCPSLSKHKMPLSVFHKRDASQPCKQCIPVACCIWKTFPLCSLSSLLSENHIPGTEADGELEGHEADSA
eukprot:1156835-Pelagomonas_calceolata.AAC.5